MLDRRTIWRLLGLRSLLSLPFLTISVVLFLSCEGLGFIEALGTGLFAASLLVVPAVLLAEPLATFVSQPVSSIYHPEVKRSSPTLMFSQPEACIMRGKYVEAMEYLSEMVMLDPSRAQVYIRMIDLALRHQGDHTAAREAFREGMRNLKDMEKRSYLAEEYSRLRLLFPENPMNTSERDVVKREQPRGKAFSWSSRHGTSGRET